MFRKFVNFLFFIIKKIIFGLLLIYAINMMTISIGIVIPMNFFTICLSMIFGIPFIIGFVIFFLIV